MRLAARRICGAALSGGSFRPQPRRLCDPRQQPELQQLLLLPALPARRALGTSVPVPASAVKELRERTGASMGKCREALLEEGGDMERATEWLRRRGVKSMEKRTAAAGEGLLAIGIGHSSGAIVELRAETDFVTRSSVFQQLSASLARTAVLYPQGGGGEDFEKALLEGAGELKQVSSGASVETALLAMGSVLGERLVLGERQRLALAAPGGVVAGYAHPRQADAVAGTGRMAALVALRPSPAPSPSKELEAELGVIAACIARHIVGTQPRFLSIESIPAEILAKEQEVYKAAYLDQLGPAKASKVEEHVLAKVLEGKTKRFYEETVLLKQELLASVSPVADGADMNASTVEAWLQVCARRLGLERLDVEDFRFRCL